MQIHGPAQLHGPQSINAPHRSQTAKPAAQATRTTQVDQLDISPEAQFASQIRDIPDVRTDRVSEIRAAIESGVYETEAKLDLALERLLDEIG